MKRVAARAHFSARWIWDQKREPRPVNATRYFRASFFLEKVPREAEVRISADARYKLYLNGSYVTRGPARSTPRFLSYDTVDVARYLREGENAIGVIVHHYGARNFTHRMGRAGLIAEVHVRDGDKGSVCVRATGPEWKVLSEVPWRNTPWRLTLQRGFVEDYDGALEPDGWILPGFDDSSWSRAVVLGPPGMPPWSNIEPREIPLPTSTEFTPVRIVEIGTAGTSRKRSEQFPVIWNWDVEKSYLDPEFFVPRLAADISQGLKGSVENPEALLEGGEGSCTIEAKGESPYIVLDFGRETSGFLQIKAEAAFGASLEVAMSESLGPDGRVDAFTALRTYYALRVTVPAGKVVNFESVEPYGLRYIRIVSRGLKGRVILHRVSFRESTYPTLPKGAFYSSDSRLNQVWRISTEALRLNMDDAFMDCPSRERGQWLGDSVIHTQVASMVFGDHLLSRRQLREAARSQKELDDGGITAHVYPSDLPKGARLPTWCVMWMVQAYEHYWRTGDAAIIEEIFPALMKAIGWFEKRRLKAGLLEDVPGWIFLDWTKIEPGDVSVGLNALYAGALDRVAYLAGKVLRKKEVEQRLLRTAGEIKKALLCLAWDPSKGLFADALDRKPGKDDGFAELLKAHQRELSRKKGATEVSEDVVRKGFSASVNWMVLWAGVVEEKVLFEEIVKLLLESPAPGAFEQENIFGLYFKFSVLSRLGLHGHVLRDIRKHWGGMLDSDATTAWETVPSTDRQTWSLCHGWGSLPVIFLGGEILGVNPLEPGYRLVRIAPHVHDLTWATGCVSTPRGEVRVRWEKEHEKRWKICLYIPGECKGGLLEMPNLGLVREIRANGIRLFPKKAVRPDSESARSLPRLVDKEFARKVFLPPGGHDVEVEFV